MPKLKHGISTQESLEESLEGLIFSASESGKVGDRLWMRALFLRFGGV